MAIAHKINLTLVVVHATVCTVAGDVRRGLLDRLDRSGDEDGDVEARTITIAVMAALALAIGAIITRKVTDKAETISLDNAP